MGTKSIIKVKDERYVVTIYHHYDGYPEGVGSNLISRFNDRLKRLTVSMVVNELLKDSKDKGYQLTFCRHTDIEYEYNIDLVKHEIRCNEATFNSNKDDFDYGPDIDLTPYYCVSNVDALGSDVIGNDKAHVHFTASVGCLAYTEVVGELTKYCEARGYTLNISEGKSGLFTELNVTIDLPIASIDTLEEYLMQIF